MLNTKALRKIIAVLLVAVVAFAATGCGGNTAQPQGAEPGTVIEETDEYVTIVDQANREVTVKKDPQSIALCYRVIIRFLINLEQGDKIVGVGKTEDFLNEIQPSLNDAVDVGKGVADVEAIAELKPDVFFHKATDVESLDAIEKLGIPSVGIRAENTEDMAVAFTILGKIFCQEEKAQQMIDFYSQHMEKCEKLTADVQDKKKAIVMGSSIGKVADGSMLQSHMIESAGGINCAGELEATELWPTAGVEQILAWNPDYIFITNTEGGVYNYVDLLSDKAWSDVTAVKNGDVYVMPAVHDSWELPGVLSALGTEFMVHVMYPELLSDEELVKDVDECYQLSYGKTFDRKELGY